MLRITPAFNNRIQAGEIPTNYVIINTDKGNRIYSEKELSGVFNQVYFLANGSVRADGLVTAGNGISALEKSDRLIDGGKLEKSIQPKTRDIINSLSFKQKNNIMVELDNYDNGISRILPLEPFLTKICWLLFGFENDNLSDHLIIFNGQINEIDVGRNKINLFVEEV